MKLVSKITNEQYTCDNFGDTLTIDGVEFIKVHKGDQFNTVLMKKSIFSQVITNEHMFDNRNQLNG